MELEFIDGDPTKGVRPIEHKDWDFNIADGDIDIPTTVDVPEDIIKEEK